MRREIASVLVTKDKIVATDSYHLIEIQSPIGNQLEESILVMPQKSMKTFDEIKKNEDGTVTLSNKGASMPAANVLPGDKYPQYGKVIPDTATAVATIIVNPKFLKDMAQAFEELKGKDMRNNIVMHIFDNATTKPIVFTNEKNTARGLLMPITPAKK